MSFPPGWYWTCLKEVTEPIRKVNPGDNPESEFIYLDISSIDNTTQQITSPKQYKGSSAPSRARQLVKAKDVLFSTVRTYLRNIALVPEIYDGQIASTGFSILRANPLTTGKFLFYFSQTESFLNPLNELQRGTSYPAVRDSDVREQPIPIPPLPEQERIVRRIESLLTQLDAGVAGLKRAQAALKRYKASVLKAACEGRLARQDPNDEPAEELLQRLGKKPLESGELPELPKRWCWVIVGDLTRKIQYGTSEKANLDSTGIPVLRMGNVQDGQLNYIDLKYLPNTTQKINNFILEEGDLIFNRTNSAELVGKSAIYKSFHPNATFASYLIRVKLLDICLPDYVAFYINSFYCKIRSKAHSESGVSRTPIPEHAAH